jgi:signal transduction histidine kinase/CheY-like chemotaxis protein
MGAGLELHLLHRDGRAIPVEIGLNPIDTDDGPYVIAAVTDISERRRAEQAVLQARAEAEHANRAKDEFLAVLSHELRNPINAILGWAQILRSASSAHLAPQGLEVIERSARAEAQLVESLLDVSRIVSGKLRLDLAQVDLAEIISAARDVVRPTADVKGISLAVELPSRPVFVTGDAGRLQQVLWNLLSNAVKFTPPGGRVEVTLASTGAEAVLVVRDDGEGISSEFLPRVFGRFTQAEGARDRTRGGLGLGLAIVRELVQAHGGTIEAASPGPDLGSTFTVRLPLAKVPGNEVAAGEVGEATLDLGGIRVLAVDPDVDARQLLAVALSTHGALVRSAASLSEARLLLDADLVDVLVADLPGSDGVALIREIRERGLLDGRGRRLPAIALTGYATAADRDAASAAGYDLHLPKPVAPAELVRAITAVRTHLARQTLAPPSPG